MPVTEPRMIRLRYPTRCVTCGTELPAGIPARWDSGTKAVTCAGCIDREVPLRGVAAATRAAIVGAPASTQSSESGPAGGPNPSGSAGGSAQREHDRRSAAREAAVRKRHPSLGGLILALSNDPSSTKVWAKGAKGERRVARRLDSLDGIVALHDRRIPRSKANIDHIAIGPNGVYVIDTKRYTGRVELRRTGTVFRPATGRLFVNGRDRTNLLEGMAKQILAVNAAADMPVAPHAPIHLTGPR
jgi:Nuclease-related domain